MSDVMLWAAMALVCGGLGLPLAGVLPAKLAWRGLLAPSFGAAVLAVVVPLGYRLGASMRAMLVAASVLALVAIGLHIRKQGVPRDRKTILFATALLVTSALLLAPRFSGGDQFAVFRGNQWDTYNYVEAAVTFGEQPYRVIRNAKLKQQLRIPTLAIAQAQLPNRPSVHELYAMFSRIAPGQAYRLYYAYLAYFMAQLVFVGLFVVRNAFPRARTWTWFVVAAAFPFGFWGQYMLDIDAWSQVVSAPLMLALVGLVLHVASDWRARDAWRLAAGIAVTTAGSVYIYPEGLSIYLAAVGPVAIGLVLARSIKLRAFGWRSWIPFTGFGGVVLALLSPDLVRLLIGQLGRSANTNVPWWQFFQRFFLGRDNAWGDGFERASDFIGSLFGFYFVTPADHDALALIQRITILIVIAGLIAGVAMLVRTREPERGVTIAWLATALLMLVPAVVLANRGGYWAAGKVVSYAAPIFVPALCLPLTCNTPWRWFAGVFAAVQLGAGLVRIPVAGGTDHIGYAAPYPSVQIPALKHDIGWALRALEPYLDRHSKVTVHPSETWSQQALITFLTARRIPFVLQAPVSSFPGSDTTLGQMPMPWTPNVELSYLSTAIQLDYFDGRPSVRIPTR